MGHELHEFKLAYYSGNRKTGGITIVEHREGQTRVKQIPEEPESELERDLKPILVGLTENDDVILLEPRSKTIRMQPEFPADSFPAHVYSQPGSDFNWYMNDGDKETGNDTLNCGNTGSSVTVIENSHSPKALWRGTVCVGRGHHQAAFSEPNADFPNVPRCAYISNLQDGSISVIGNDPEDTERYLKLLGTINLCDPEKEDDGRHSMPNHAFPHGLCYSPVSGKLYCLNNGYGAITVIDPVSLEVEQRIPFKGYSNLFGTLDGRYLIGRGADRKSDPDHVVANIAVFDVISEQITDKLALQDIYLSKYFYTPKGDKLYFTTGASGNDSQKQNLKTDALLAFDLTGLPKIKQTAELRMGGPVGTVDFSQKGDRLLVFTSNTEQGTVTVIDGNTDREVERIDTGNANSHSRLWALQS